MDIVFAQRRYDGDAVFATLYASPGEPLGAPLAAYVKVGGAYKQITGWWVKAGGAYKSGSPSAKQSGAYAAI